MKNEVLSYETDGLTMRSQFYADEEKSGARPDILVFPEIFGLSDHARKQAERLASLGFATLACDLHGEGRLLAGLEEAREVMAPLRENPQRIRDRARASLDALASRPEVDGSRLAAIGYCFGGSIALELARSGADIVAAVGFHSGLATAAPQDARNIRGKVLVCIGADDPGIPPEQRSAFAQPGQGPG